MLWYVKKWIHVCEGVISYMKHIFGSDWRTDSDLVNDSWFIVIVVIYCNCDILPGIPLSVYCYHAWF